jgi:Mlc titration factor MtfA (ptsG expression regulator)
MNILILIFFLFAGAIVSRYLSKRAEQKRLLDTRLTGREWDIILDNVPLIDKLPMELHQKLEGKINLFLHQVAFHGCDDLEVTETMELSIAAQASLMVVNTDQWYDTLQTILIYPGAFKSTHTERDGYITREVETVRTGESWARGPVILSWADSAAGAFNDEDGHNVVLHEFAHQLDGLSGSTDGAPVLAKDHAFADWVDILNASYDRLQKRVENGQPTFLDEYGATAPAEYFAVAVEVFFEKPKSLQKHEPEVYNQISKYFNLDPSAW